MQIKNFVQVGNVIPLAAQLHDGAVNQKVSAVVYGPNGEHLDSISLAHGSSGFYFSNSYTMPDLPWVTVSIIAEGLDSLGQEYALVSETFLSSPVPATPEKVFRGGLVNVRTVDKIFKGVLVEAKSRSN